MKSALDADPSDNLAELANLLIKKNSELIQMWWTLEKLKSGDDEVWVWAFLEAALHASRLPPYHYIPNAERVELSKEIKRVRCNDCSDCVIQCPNGVHVRDRLIRAQELLA